MSRTGPLVATMSPLPEVSPLNWAASSDQVTPEPAVAVLPVPEESVTDRPEAWFSFHQPAG